jgi:hypothetical protein
MVVVAFLAGLSIGISLTNLFFIFMIRSAKKQFNEFGIDPNGNFKCSHCNKIIQLPKSKSLPLF